MENSELLERVRRVETRLARLCSHLGMDKGDNAALFLSEDGEVNLRALDVPISSILRFIRANKVHKQVVPRTDGIIEVPVFFRDRVTAYVVVKDEHE